MKESLKKKLFLAVRLAVSFGLIGYILYRIAAEHELGDLLAYWTGMNYWWVVGSFLITFGLLGVGAVRWGMLLAARGVKLSWLSLFMYYLVGMFFNNFLPTTVGGDVVKAYYLSRSTGKTALAFISVLLDRLVGIGGLCVVAIASCILGGRMLWSLPATRPYALTVFLIVGGLSLGLGLFFLVSFNDRVMNLFLSLARRGKIGGKIRRFRQDLVLAKGRHGLPYRVLIILPGTWMMTFFLAIGHGGKIIGKKILELHQALYLYKGRSAVFLKTVLISTGIWVMIVVAAWMVSLAFSTGPAAKFTPVSIIYFFLFMPPIAAIMSLPISFAGIGTREVGFIIFFGALEGVSAPDALVVSLTFYFLYLAASLFGGVIYVFKDSIRLHRELPDDGLVGAAAITETEKEYVL